MKQKQFLDKKNPHANKVLLGGRGKWNDLRKMNNNNKNKTRSVYAEFLFCFKGKLQKLHMYKYKQTNLNLSITICSIEWVKLSQREYM